MKFTIQVEGAEDFFYAHLLDTVINICRWIAGIILGILILSYLQGWFIEHIKIDPLLKQGHIWYIEPRDQRKKWLVINPATKWELLEGIYLYLYWLITKKTKKEHLTSDARRVRILRRIWISAATLIFIIGIFSSFFLFVSAEGYQAEVFPYLLKIQVPEHPMHYAAKKEEPKQEKSALSQPISTQPDPKPQTSKSDQKTISKNEPDQNQEPELKQAAKENKPQSREVKQNHKELVYHKELDQRIHKINQNLQQIEKKLDSIHTKLPDSSSRDRSIELNRTIEEVKETLGEITKQVNELQQQIPIVNELELPRILR